MRESSARGAAGWPPGRQAAWQASWALQPAWPSTHPLAGQPAGRLAEGNHLENTPTLLTWPQRGAQKAPSFGGV